jgi:signal transduction histidine kinase
VTGEANQAPNTEMAVLATVAHELRGPLTALATSSELLAEDFEVLDPDQVRGMLSAIHRRTLWLQGLVESNRATDWGVVMAGATVISIPVIVFFLFVQKRMSAGLVAGAVKG